MWLQEEAVPFPPHGPPEWRELCLRCGAKGHMAEVKQPAFIFHGRLEREKAPSAGNRKDRRRPFMKIPFLWLINQICSPRATV